MQPASMHLHDLSGLLICLKPSVTLSQWPVEAVACRGGFYHIGAISGEVILGKVQLMK